MNAHLSGMARDEAACNRSQGVFDNLDTAAATWCLAQMAYFVGLDAIGDAALESLNDALDEDRIKDDDREIAREHLRRRYATSVECAGLLTWEAAAIARRTAPKLARAIAEVARVTA